MASVDKVRLGEVTYDVSPSATGTLNGFTSNDNGTPPTWTEVNTVTTSDTNSSIFSKLTSMVKNVRWLYNKLGTDDFSTTGSDTVTGALSNLQSGLNGKANSSHSHTTSTLPVSNNQVNSVNYIPTSALLYSMSQRAEGIQSVVGTAKRELDDPNKRYESKNLGTFTAYDIDMMLSEYTHENNYGDLALGNYFTLQNSGIDGYADFTWKIAGFDMEHNQLAADDTVYDNGHGICLVPSYYVTSNQWGINNTIPGGYNGSKTHTVTLPYIVSTSLNATLGDHIINRNVLLSSNVDVDSTASGPNAYTWTTAKATLMSVGQLTGTFASHTNKYDDGEANYKLPLFNYEDYKAGTGFLTRCVSGYYGVYRVYSNGSIDVISPESSSGIRPLIYIR